MASNLFALVVSLAVLVYVGGLWLAWRHKRPAGSRPERREGYREQAAGNDQAALLREQERSAATRDLVAGLDAYLATRSDHHDCPICATLPPVARPGTCDTLGQMHDGVPVEVLLAERPAGRR